MYQEGVLDEIYVVTDKESLTKEEYLKRKIDAQTKLITDPEHRWFLGERAGYSPNNEELAIDWIQKLAGKFEMWLNLSNPKERRHLLEVSSSFELYLLEDTGFVRNLVGWFDNDPKDYLEQIFERG